MKQYINIFTLLILFSCGDKKSALEKEISQLKNQEAIKNYWQEIHNSDQAHRGLQSNDSIDNLNFKKMIFLIQHHGYPTKKTFGEKINITPNVVFTHQTSEYVSQRYFPILHQAFLEGKADTYWFLHNVKGLHRGRFGRDLIRGRELETGDINTILNALNIPLKPKLDFSLKEFEELFTTFHEEVAKIRSSEIKGKWMNDSGDFYIVNKFEKDLFIQKVYRDESFTFPQKINFIPKEKKYEYVDNLGFNDYFTINDEENLVIHFEKKGLLETHKIQMDSVVYFYITF